MNTIRHTIEKALTENDSKALRYLCSERYGDIREYWELWADSQEQAQLRLYLYGA
jgi:hypothetical protein